MYPLLVLRSYQREVVHCVYVVVPIQTRFGSGVFMGKDLSTRRQKSELDLELLSSGLKVRGVLELLAELVDDVADLVYVRVLVRVA